MPRVFTPYRGFKCMMHRATGPVGDDTSLAHCIIQTMQPHTDALIKPLAQNCERRPSSTGMRTPSMNRDAGVERCAQLRGQRLPVDIQP